MAPEIALPLAGTLPDGSEDAELLEGCRNGSLSAYESLYRTHSNRMKSLAYHMLGSRLDAEDAVQETFLKTFRTMRTFAGQCALSTWVFRILVNTCRDVRRKRQRQPEFDLQPELAHSGTPDLALRLALRRALASLDDAHRMVFVLFEVEGLRHSEIAAILDVSEGACRARLFEAKRRLKRLLNPPGATQ